MFYHRVLLVYQKVKMILWSIHTFWHKGLAENKENAKSEKGIYLSKVAAQTRRLISQEMSNNVGIDNSQMRCKCYTRYKSKPIYQIW